VRNFFSSVDLVRRSYNASNVKYAVFKTFIS